MDEIKLVKPSAEYAEDIWRFREELLQSEDEDRFAGCGVLRSCASAREWIETVKLWSSEETCPADKVPSDIYIAVRLRDRKIVGVTDLRHHIDHPILSVWGGHIGYSVRPGERNKGYAGEMLRQNLMFCRQRGLKKVLITCSDRNCASERTILSGGGVYESTVEVDGRNIKRYWITL